jgi:hypothetical protein
MAERAASRNVTRTSRLDVTALIEVIAAVLLETIGSRETMAKAATTETVVWRVPLFCTMGTSSAPVRGPAVVSSEIF